MNRKIQHFVDIVIVNESPIQDYYWIAGYKNNRFAWLSKDKQNNFILDHSKCTFIVSDYVPELLELANTLGLENPRYYHTCIKQLRDTNDE